MPSHNKRVIDIAPPNSSRRGEIQRTFSVDQEDKGEQKPRFRSPKPILLGLLILLGGLGMVHVFFAKAQVLIQPQVREVVLEEQVRVLPDADRVQPVTKSIPGSVINQSIQDTKLFPASSSEKRADRATGVIRVYNTQRRVQTLIANTRFLSENNKLFRISSQIRVPAAGADGSPGVLDVKVTAAEPGPDYNIEPANFALPGLAGSPLYTQVYAKSFQAMKGGRIEEVKVVGEDDIEDAKEALVASLKERALEQVRAGFPAGTVVDPELVSVEVLEASTPVRVGAEVSEFNVSAEIQVSGLAFQMEDLKTLARELLRTNLEQNEDLKEGLDVSYERARLQEESLVLSLEARGEAHALVDSQALKRQIQGLGEAAAEKVLGEYLAVARAEVSLWPFWVQSIPGNEERIRIEFRLD